MKLSERDREELDPIALAGIAVSLGLIGVGLDIVSKKLNVPNLNERFAAWAGRIVPKK